MARRKKRTRKAKPLRQSWRDLISRYTRAKVAKAKRARQALEDAKKRDAAAQEAAKVKAEKDRRKAEARAQKEAAREAERRAATQRAQQRAAERGPTRVGGTVVATGATGGAVLCGHPHISNPRLKCGNPVLPGTMTCAAGHPQGSSSFGGPGRRPSKAERDQKFFDLRAAGWAGAIDQDGNKVADVDEWVRSQGQGRR